MLTVQFDPSDNTKINAKIDQYISGRNYDTYMKRDAVKPEYNEFQGKKAEYHAIKWFTGENEYQINNKFYPDIQIYTNSQKSWEADIPFRKLASDIPDVHVKSCDGKFIRGFGKGECSWTFQYMNKGGRGGKDKLFRDNKSDEDLICLVFMDDPRSPFGEIKKIAKWKHVKPFTKDPIYSKLIGQKKCIYESDLDKIEGIYDCS